MFQLWKWAGTILLLFLHSVNSTVYKVLIVLLGVACVIKPLSIYLVFTSVTELHSTLHQGWLPTAVVGLSHSRTSWKEECARPQGREHLFGIHMWTFCSHVFKGKKNIARCLLWKNVNLNKFCLSWILKQKGKEILIWVGCGPVMPHECPQAAVQVLAYTICDVG